MRHNTIWQLPNSFKKNTFNIRINHHIPIYKQLLPVTWTKYLTTTSEWILHLLKNISINLEDEPLLYHIQQNIPLIISTDGAKDERNSGNRWIIALHSGKYIVSGHSPNFEQMKAMSSYRSKIYASLSIILYLHTYSIFMMSLLKANVHHCATMRSM